PPEGIGLILGVDRLLDMCRTTNNVTGDLMIASVVSRGEEEIAEASASAGCAAGRARSGALRAWFALRRGRLGLGTQQVEQRRLSPRRQVAEALQQGALFLVPCDGRGLARRVGPARLAHRARFAGAQAADQFLQRTAQLAAQCRQYPEARGL